MFRPGVILMFLAIAGCSSYPKAVKYPVPGWFKPAFDTLDVGLPVPDFSLDDLSGRTWHLEEQRGKVVVLTFACNTDPSYVMALDAFQKEVVAPFADRSDVVFVTVYSQESHPELAGGKWNPDVIDTATLEQRREAASAEEYRLRFRARGKKYDVSGRRPTGPNCVTLLDGIADSDQPVVGKLYGYGRGGSTNPVFLIDRRGRLKLKSIWLRDVLSVTGHRQGNLAEALRKLLDEQGKR